MKKPFSLILSVFLCLGLFGCSNQAPLNPEIPEESTTIPSADETSEETPPTQTEETSPYVPIRESLVSVCLPVQTQQFYAEDGTLLLSSHVQIIDLTIQEPEIANRVILDFLNRVDSVSQSTQSLYQSAIASYTPDAPWTPYLCQQLYSPTRLDPGVLSLYGTNITFSGFSHPDKTCVSANYNLITGEVLTLGSILTNIDQIEVLCDMVIEQLRTISSVKLYSDFAQTVRNRFASDESTNEKWFFTRTGLCFYFSPYEIAPYNAGIILAEIPYDSLLGILDDAYFPAERMEVSGALTCTEFSKESIADVSYFTEAVLTENTKMLTIRADSPVQNIHIEMFVEGELITVFSAYALYTDEAIVLEASEDQLNAITIYYGHDGQSLSIPDVS